MDGRYLTAAWKISSIPAWMIIAKALIITFALVFACSGYLQAGETGVAGLGLLKADGWPQDNRVPLANTVVVWDDDEIEESPEQILQRFRHHLAEGEGEWLDYATEYSGGHYTQRVVWAALRLQNLGNQPWHLVFQNTMVLTRDVSLFLSTDGGATEQVSFGFQHPFSERAIKNRHFVHPFVVGPNSSIDLVMRMRMAGNPHVVINNSYLLPASNYTFPLNHSELLRWLYTGAMSLLSLMSLIAGFVNRDRIFANFSLFVASATLLQFAYEGYGQLFMWPNSQYLAARGVFIFILLLLYSAIEFGRNFLDLKLAMPRVYRLFTVFVVLLLTGLFLTLVAPEYLLVPVLNVSLVIFFIAKAATLVVGYRLWHQGNRMAMQFSLAWTAFFLILLYQVAEVYFVESNESMSRIIIDIWMFILSLSLFVGLLQKEGHAKQERDRAIAENKAKSEFLSNMAHEIRTPMNAILGFSHLLQLDEKATPEQKESLAIINSSGKHLLGLINQVLEISKIEAGRVSYVRDNFDIDELLHSIKMMFGEQCDEAHLTLSVNKSPAIPRFLYGDHGKLNQILINLLGNAVKFTKTGGITLRASVDDQSKNDLHLIFEVEDTGAGIKDNERENVFATYKQTQSGIDSGEGTGLGLAISREYAHLMGGDISFESTPGKGSVFTLSFSCEPGHAGDSDKPRLMVPVGIESHQEYRVLVVDDKESNRTLLRHFLSPIGFQLEEASNGEEAVAKFHSWSPDLILMDNRMPVMDGMEATRLIRESELDSRAPIIAVTASAFENDRQAILDMGACEFVCKPVDAQELFEKIAQLLNISYRY